MTLAVVVQIVVAEALICSSCPSEQVGAGPEVRGQLVQAPAWSDSSAEQTGRTGSEGWRVLVWQAVTAELHCGLQYRRHHEYEYESSVDVFWPFRDKTMTVSLKGSKIFVWNVTSVKWSCVIKPPSVCKVVTMSSIVTMKVMNTWMHQY